MNKVSHLRRLRILTGLSLTAVSSSVGISPSHLSMSERGIRILPERAVKDLAKIYKVDPEILTLSGGHIPAWLLEKIRQNPVEAMQAGTDSFEMYKRSTVEKFDAKG